MTANLVDIHPSLQFQPRADTMVTVGSDTIWRYTTADRLYTVGGGTLLPAGGNGSSYVGTTAEAAVQYQLSRHVAATVSYSHMFTGSAVAAAAGGDMDFAGAWLAFTW